MERVSARMSLSLKNFGIRQRLLGAFVGVGAILVASSLFFIWQQQNQNLLFKQSQALGAEKLEHGAIERKILQVQSIAKLYSFGGRSSSIRQVKILMADIQKRVDMAKERAVDPRVRALIDRMLPLIKDTSEHFEDVVRERTKRQHLTSQIFPEQIKSLEHFFKFENSDNGRIQALIKQAEVHVLSYLENIDQKDIEEAIEHLDQALELSNTKNLPDILNAFKQFRDTIVAISQSTKAYLFFVNVVMSADTAELVYLSRRLDEISAEILQQQQGQLNHAGLRYLSIISTICGLVFLITLLTGWAMGRSIVLPIVQLRNTFLKLSRDESVEIIPGVDDRHELGDLARSAEAFRDKNRLTQKLLGESQNLAGHLAKSKEELALSHREMEQFVYTVSHDLKSPLVTATGYLGLVKDMLSRGEISEALDKVGRLEHSNIRMAHLINDLLELSRLGKTEQALIKVDLQEILREIKEEWSAKLKGEMFELTLASDLPCVWGHESRIIQVFENLVGNAIKYGRGMDGRPNKIYIDWESRPGYWVVRVRDFGQGIERDFHEKVFGLFSRLRVDVEGTGVGLTIVKKVMQLCHGEVWIESPVDGGVCFCLRFPKNTP
jgi:signal transduction histidine kinase